MRAMLVIAGVASCARPVVTATPPKDRIAIVGAERGPHGARLIALDEHGDREFELVEPSRTETVRDSSPAISPDGRWMVFASSRERNLDETSLWIARLGPEARPRRLTQGTSIDSHPTWTPDGHAIVFASTRAAGNFDLWRLPMRDGVAAGEPVQLTTAPGHEITPTIARDGTIIYAAVTPSPNGTVESHLESLAPDGAIARLSEGPGDASPALSPDGRTIAFARPVAHARIADAELWRMNRDGSNVSQVIDLRLTDESGPVWSGDGRYLFATSLMRGADGRPLFSSIICIDLAEPTATARILEDRAGAIARFTPALTTTPLDNAALRSDPEYVPELGRIMAQAIDEQRAHP
ncbi:MAG TPA: hypothetical protein VGO00_19480 [Kofleriaceae bacterium]|nr:hypothetical protein [Kofleriaceae bacterium]